MTRNHTESRKTYPVNGRRLEEQKKKKKKSSEFCGNTIAVGWKMTRVYPWPAVIFELTAAAATPSADFKPSVKNRFKCRIIRNTVHF